MVEQSCSCDQVEPNVRPWLKLHAMELLTDDKLEAYDAAEMGATVVLWCRLWMTKKISLPVRTVLRIINSKVATEDKAARIFETLTDSDVGVFQCVDGYVTSNRLRKHCNIVSDEILRLREIGKRGGRRSAGTPHAIPNGKPAGKPEATPDAQAAGTQSKSKSKSIKESSPGPDETRGGNAYLGLDAKQLDDLVFKWDAHKAKTAPNFFSYMHREYRQFKANHPGNDAAIGIAMGTIALRFLKATNIKSSVKLMSHMLRNPKDGVTSLYQNINGAKTEQQHEEAKQVQGPVDEEVAKALQDVGEEVEEKLDHQKKLHNKVYQIFATEDDPEVAAMSFKQLCRNYNIPPVQAEMMRKTVVKALGSPGDKV